MKKLVILILIIFVNINLFSISDNIIAIKELNISLKKPNSWFLVTKDELFKNWLVNKRIDKNKLESYKNDKFITIAMSKYKEPYDDPNPSIQVYIYPMKSTVNISSQQILKNMSIYFAKTSGSFTVIDPITNLIICGHNASYMKSIKTWNDKEDRSTTFINKYYAIIRNDDYVVIQLSTSLKDKYECENIFNNFMKGIKL